jgi:phosphohistidine phosphatase
MGVLLFLIRHEDAEPGHNMPDAHRGLTALGRRRMRATGSLFAANETVDVIFTSPMVRAVQTTEIFAAALGHDAPIIAARAVAEPRTADEFLSVMNPLRADQRRVAIVGHEPTMSHVASHLLGSRFPRSFSKGMILALDYDPDASSAEFRFLIDGDGPTLLTSLP